MANTITKCSNCEAVLLEATDTPVEPRRPCPRCGSTNRIVEAELSSKLTFTAQVLKIEMRSRLFVYWSRIAVREEAISWRARKEAAAARRRDASTELAGFLQREQDAALVAICAAAFALDAFYGDLTELQLVPQQVKDAWKRKGAPRHAQVLETLKQGFNVGRASHIWLKELEWLYDVRDGAVHFRGRLAETFAHPLGTNISADVAEFRPESATRAVDLIMDVLATTTQNPKPATAELSAGLAKLVTDAKALRQAEAVG